MRFTGKVVRGFSAFVPCLEHVRARGGGGGSVENVVFFYICRGIFVAFISLCICTK